jgi:hypothetical protein
MGACEVADQQSPTLHGLMMHAHQVAFYRHHIAKHAAQLHYGSTAMTIMPNRAGQGLCAPTAPEQRTARIMGAWFLGTFVLSIPAYFFYDPLLNHADYVAGSGATSASPLEPCSRSSWRSPA